MQHYSDLVNQAFERTKTLIWPFNKTVWFKLFIIYAFAGGSLTGLPDLSRMINSASNRNDSKTEAKNSNPTDPSPATIPTATQTTVDKNGNVETNNKPAPSPQFEKIKTTISEFWKDNRSLAIGLAVVLAALIFLIMFVFIWLYSRFSFVAVRALDSNDVQIKSHWRATEREGESFFRLNLYFSLIMFFVMACVGGIIYLLVRTGTRPDISSILMMIAVGIGALFLFFLLAVAVGSLFTFLPIAMYDKKENALTAIKRIINWCLANKKAALINGLLYWLTMIAVEIAVGIIAVISTLAIGIPLGIVAVILAISLKSLSAVIQGIILAVGIAFLILIFVGLSMLIRVPVQTFFTYLRIILVRRLPEIVASAPR